MLRVPNEWSQKGCLTTRNTRDSPLPPCSHNEFSRPKYQSSEVARPWAQGSDGRKLHPAARPPPAEAAPLGVHSETALGPHPAQGAPSEPATWPQPPN